MTTSSDDVEYPDKDPASYWTKHIGEVVEGYNSHVQANTNMKPEDAEKPENEFDVKTNLQINAAHRRKSPDIEVVGEVIPFIRADLHLIEKGKELKNGKELKKKKSSEKKKKKWKEKEKKK